MAAMIADLSPLPNPRAEAPYPELEVDRRRFGRVVAVGRVAPQVWCSVGVAVAFGERKVGQRTE